MEQSPGNPTSSTLHRFLTIAVVPAVGAMFLPFAYDTSPLNGALDRGLWMVATPFFLPLVAGVGQGFLLGRRMLPASARATAYGVGAAFGCVTLYSFYLTISEAHTAMEWAGFAASVLLLVAGCAIVIRSRRAPNLRDAAAIVALQTPYAANATLCLGLLFDNLESGAYCALLGTGAYLVQMGLVARQSVLRAV